MKAKVKDRIRDLVQRGCNSRVVCSVKKQDLSEQTEQTNEHDQYFMNDWTKTYKINVSSLLELQNNTYH